MIKVKIKKLHPDAVVPNYAHENDICVDLTAVSKNKVDKGKYGYIEYGCGFAIDIPVGYVGRIVPRSSVSNTGLILANTPGTVDPGYHGEIFCRFKAIPGTEEYEIGDRIAQMSVEEVPKIEFEEVDDLGESERGEKGWGSTGK